MGYFINPRKRKDGTIAWGLAFRSEAGGVRSTKRIKATDLRQYGLLPSMPVEEARERCKQLNKEKKHYRAAEKAKVGALAEANMTREMSSRLFPPGLVKEFEDTRLKPKFLFGGPRPEEKYKKAITRWRFVIRMLAEVDRLPQEWCKEPRVFYAYFVKCRISPSYAARIIGILNMWGFFVSDKQGKAFLPVPFPQAYEREVIRDAGKLRPGVKKASKPITPELLEGAKAGLPDPFYRWLYISVWFGLRPMEVSAGPGQLLQLPFKGTKVNVVGVYQTKLGGAAVKDPDRWKYIPVLCPEQEKALKWWQEGQIKTPYQALLHGAFGRGYGKYGGRKGFASLMKRKGHTLLNVSKWLGHSSIAQTIDAYVDLVTVDFD